MNINANIPVSDIIEKYLQHIKENENKKRKRK